MALALIYRAPIEEVSVFVITFMVIKMFSHE